MISEAQNPEKVQKTLKLHIQQMKLFAMITTKLIKLPLKPDLDPDHKCGK